MHFHSCQIGQDFRRILQLDPVELDILAGREMPVAAIVLARDIGKACASAPDDKQTVRHGDAQHIRMDLHVQAVLQAQRAEFVFGQFIRQAAAHLVAKLRDPFRDIW